MHPFGSKRSLHSNPQIKGGRTVVKRAVNEEVEAQLPEEPDDDVPRCSCGAKATRVHVPRGCTCQEDANAPCIEFREL